MKTTKAAKPVKSPAIVQDFPHRLAELEIELRRYITLAASDRILKSVVKPAEVTMGKEKAVQFQVKDHVYAAGRTDNTYSGSNHARGVRHIRFYMDGNVVLEIEGDFEDQQFGSNFRFQNMKVYLPGTWETDFVKLTDDLRLFKANQKIAFKKKRDAENAKARR